MNLKTLKYKTYERNQFASSATNNYSIKLTYELVILYYIDVVIVVYYF